MDKDGEFRRMIETALTGRGCTPDQIREAVELVGCEVESRAIPRMAEVLHRIFLRLDRDSVAGRALSRALGFTNGQSLGRAARDYGMSKQYLHKLESALAAKLRDVAVGPAPEVQRVLPEEHASTGSKPPRPF